MTAGTSRQICLTLKPQLSLLHLGVNGHLYEDLVPAPVLRGIMPEQPLPALTPDPATVHPLLLRSATEGRTGSQLYPKTPQKSPERVVGALLLVVMWQGGSEAIGAHTSPSLP